MVGRALGVVSLHECGLVQCGRKIFLLGSWQAAWSECVSYWQLAIVHSQSLPYSRGGVASFKVEGGVQAVAALAGSAGGGKKSGGGMAAGFSEAEAGK